MTTVELAASTLVPAGRSIDAITSLACLVADDQTIKDILKYFWERGGGKRSSYIGGFTEVLRQIAQHHRACDDKAMERLADLRARVTGGAPEFRKAFLRLFVDQVKVGEDAVHVNGSAAAISHVLAVADRQPKPGVASYMSEWRAECDETGHGEMTITL